MKTEKEMMKDVEVYLSKNIIAFKGEIDAFKKAFDQNPVFAIQYRAESVTQAQIAYKLAFDLVENMNQDTSVVHKLATVKEAIEKLSTRIIEWNIGKSDSTSRAANLVDYSERDAYCQFVKDLRRLSGVDFV